ncbi:mitotic checkpoint serine/threonine-protein kinase BUB1 beta-like [Ornithodoros turicata]|uniref:mitotic checkpoint serine/threonine-protein kinase BUB1 beta-like n=1 Tax=Ornithodoros turicata TaxID=34597 RepID=UPI00313981DC
MTDSEHQWELTKENIQPLKQGRAMSSLQVALVPQCRDALEDRRREFEAELRTYSGDDPLHVWHEYMLWIEQHYPAGGHKVHMPGLLEKCIQQCFDNQKYEKDPRFLDVWLRYATLVNDTTEVFKMMLRRNICTSMAKFYVAVANHHESMGNFRAASAMLEEGLQRGAQPASVLHTAKSQLEVRVGRSVREAVEDGHSTEQREGEMLPPADQELRTVLGALKPHGKKAVVGTTRVGDFKLSMQGGVSACLPSGDTRPTGNKRKVQVLDENKPSTSSAVVSAPTAFTEASKESKENAQQAGKWSKAKAPQKRVPVSTVQQKFQIHEEENANVLAPLPSVLPPNVLSSHKSTEFADWVTPRMLFEPQDPSKRVMYDKGKVYAGTTEFQFEEIRFAKMQAQQLEQERREKEAARDQEIQELRAKVESLTRLLSRLQTGGSANAERIRALKENITMAEQSILSENHQNIPALPRQHTPECETSSSSCGVATDNSSQQRCKDSATADLSRVVRGLWDGTLSTEETGATNHLEAAVVAKRAAAFEIFADPTQLVNAPHPENEVVRTENNVATQGVENVPCGVEENADEEHDENCAPYGYVPPPKLLRRLSGILQPSEDIPVAPIDEQDGKVQNDDDMAGIHPFHDDVNVTNFGSSSAFLKKKTSTPFPTEEKHEVEDFTVGPLAALNAVRIPGEIKGLDQGVSTMPHPNTTLNQPTRDLSVILECSKETSSKSGSSSSGSSAASISGHATSVWASRQQTVPLSAVEEQVEETNHVTTGCNSRADESIHLSSAPLNPFDKDVQNAFMAHLEVPPEDRPGFSYLDHNVPPLRPGSSITIGSQGDQYYVSKQVAQGAYGKVYHAKLLPEGSILMDDETCPEEAVADVVLKVVKPCDNLWEFCIMAELAARLTASGLPSVARSVASAYVGAFYKNGSVLVMPYCQYGTLLDLVNVFKHRGESVPECLTLYFTLEMLIVLAKMHSVEIIHGDVKPDNILILDFPDDSGCTSNLAKETSCIYFTDFGRGIDMRQYERGTTFNCVVDTDGFQCVEMKDGRPWTYQTDWYGFLGCVHTLLFGTYMETQKKADGTWDIKQRLKRYWKQDIWGNLFTTLLNIPSCSEIPDVTPFIWAIHAALQEGKAVQELIIRAKKAKYWMNKTL